MPVPHERPLSYIKNSLMWSLYYLKHEYTFEDAIKSILKKGGETMANAAIVGGLIGASCEKQAPGFQNALTLVESHFNARPNKF